MSMKKGLTLSEAACSLADTLLQSSATTSQQKPQRIAARRPGESQKDAQRRVDAFHAARAGAAPAAAASTEQPTWLKWGEMQVLGTVETVAAAMDTYYKPDRLNGDPGMRGRLIADREQSIEREGWTCFASHHDAVNGRGMYLRKLDNGLTVYMSNR
jgi:hypothetical protein